MGISDLQALAHRLDVAPMRLTEVIDTVCAGLPQAYYYVFRADVGDWPQPPPTLTAFPDPDAALAFTQRQGELVPGRLLPVGARDLVALLLSDAAIDALLFVDALPVAAAPARSMRVERRVLLQELTGVPAVPMLTARAYDSLQFGVDFVQRGTFRAALTAVIEGIVAHYVPPPGSLDIGTRSVYAATAVEAWLRDNGFPHVAQRRWIAVAGDPGWAGAEELCELSCGTAQRLVVQLLIYRDGERQYIGRVVVTS